MASGYHGWALANTAVFLSPMDGGGVGLWMQRSQDTACVGMFASQADAEDFSTFMDEALAATGAANAKLLTELERMRDATQAADHRPVRHDEPRVSPAGRRSR